MNDGYLVVITSLRYHDCEVYLDKREFECDTLKNAVRIVLTFKPRRGYVIDEYKISENKTLV